MHDVWGGLFWGGGCSAGGIAGTGSALGCDLSPSAELRHDMRCLLSARVIRHRANRLSVAVVASLAAHAPRLVWPLCKHGAQA